MQNQPKSTPFKVVIDPALMAQLREYQAQIPHIEAEITIAEKAGLDVSTFRKQLADAKQQATQILAAYGNRS